MTLFELLHLYSTINTQILGKTPNYGSREFKNITEILQKIKDHVKKCNVKFSFVTQGEKDSTLWDVYFKGEDKDMEELYLSDSLPQI